MCDTEDHATEAVVEYCKALIIRILRRQAMTELHLSGDCKPCQTYHSRRGCRWEWDCHFCHVCSLDEFRIKRYHAKQKLRAKKRLIRNISGLVPDELRGSPLSSLLDSESE
eukprot:TRINITY_DN11674_c0_g2_i1.p2 TRINITY_DN11674_c0_g2~~TRINITY_DN11674_c0_g2_i1.p2  ORF type:complete len:119 (-),score=12.63 TRINITY_DN11674_c0_g2_i1:488-820(-)